MSEINAARDLPLVSALVCSYNYARFLPRTLDSALAQDYPPERLEIVVVDDGSTDATPEILAEYVARYPRRIRVFRQRNGGLAKATERAIAEARGELLALLDADDVWPARKTREQVAIFERRPEVGGVYSDMRLVDAEGNELAPSLWQLNGQVPIVGPDSYTPLTFGGNPCIASSVMVRAGLRDRFLPMPRTPIYVDWWVMAQAAIVSELAVADGYRVDYRSHDSNTTLAVTDLSSSMRERVRAGSTRRATLARGGAAVLSVDRIGAMWALIEWDALASVKKFGTAFVEFPQPGEEDRERSVLYAERAARLMRRGRHEQSLRSWLAAAAENVYNHLARDQVKKLSERFAQLPEIDDPLAPARSFVVLAELADLEREPELLVAYGDAFGEEDDATLFVLAPDVEPVALEQRFEGLLGRVGLDPDSGPDIVAVPDLDGEFDPAVVDDLVDLRLSRECLPALRERYEQSLIPLRTLPPVPSRIDGSEGGESVAAAMHSC